MNARTTSPLLPSSNQARTVGHGFSRANRRLHPGGFSRCGTGAECRRKRIVLRALHHMGPNRVLMDILPPRHKLLHIAHSPLRKPLLPNGKLRTHPMRKTTLDQSNSTLDRDLQRRNQQMYMVRHHHKRMQLVSPLRTVMLQGLKEQPCICFTLKQPSTLIGNARDEIRRRGTRRVRHGWQCTRTAAAKAVFMRSHRLARPKPCPTVCA
jgi:hypothetical protein